MQSDLAAAALAKRNELALTLAQLAGRIEDDTTTLRSMRHRPAPSCVTREGAGDTTGAEEANAALEVAHANQLRAREGAVTWRRRRRGERDAQDRLVRARGHEARVAALEK